MRSLEISTTCLVTTRPALLSNKRPARIAIVRGAWGHRNTPPSDPAHGVGPAPFHGAGGGCTCAHSVTLSRMPSAGGTTAVLRIVSSPGQEVWQIIANDA